LIQTYVFFFFFSHFNFFFSLENFKLVPRFQRGVYVPIPAVFCDPTHLDAVAKHAKVSQRVVELSISLPGRNVLDRVDDCNDNTSENFGAYISFTTELGGSRSSQQAGNRDPAPLFVSPLPKKNTPHRPGHLLSHVCAFYHIYMCFLHIIYTSFFSPKNVSFF
jgi:hypothetical protein